MSDPIDLIALKRVIVQAKKVAKQYRAITGKPLGITGEIGEFIAADLLDLKLTEARQPAYDAIAPDGRRVQIKTRCVLPDTHSGGRLGRIKLDHEWDTVMLVLIDIDFKPIVIYEAPRADIVRELKKPGSKARNERGALSISKFKAIASIVWSRENTFKEI
ncbi:MAG: hypothetical protein ABSA18_14115 [Dehalococcoidia bacterium]|jgi:hypothetical protein